MLADTSWNMWQRRNDANNQFDTPLSSIEINNRVTAEYQLGFFHLPEHIKLQMLVGRASAGSLGMRKNWLHNVSTGRHFVATLRARNLPPPRLAFVEWI